MKPVLIAGGGIGGLTLALALERRGIPAVVLEQANRLEEVGAGLQLSPNGTRALASIDLLEAVSAIAVEPEGKRIRLWNTGEMWPLFDLGPVAVAEYGFPYLMVHRGDLQTVLLDAVGDRAPGILKMGCRVSGFEQDGSGVTALMEDGSRVEGRMLIGADGVHSAVRHGLFGESKADFTGCMAWRGVIEASRLPERMMKPAVGVNWVGPGRHVITYPLRNGELMNFVGVVESDAWRSESWTARGSREECAADFADWHSDIHLMIDNIEDHYRWALLSRAPLDEWHRGRVALLGDASHPMLPFMAQGAVMAIEDAIVLARAIEAFDDVEAALSSYVAARIERATRCVQSADRQRIVFHNDQLSDADDAANYVATQWSEERVYERYDWLFSHDVTSVELASPTDILAAG